MSMMFTPNTRRLSGKKRNKRNCTGRRHKPVIQPIHKVGKKSVRSCGIISRIYPSAMPVVTNMMDRKIVSKTNVSSKACVKAAMEAALEPPPMTGINSSI